MEAISCVAFLFGIGKKRNGTRLGGHHYEVQDLEDIITMQLEDAESKYGIPQSETNITKRFTRLVKDIYEKTGTQVVVLIDEYDAPMLTVLHDSERLEQMRTELQAFYSPLKDLDPYLRFVFITGITKFSQLSIFSQLNNLNNISMLPQYAAMCGITAQQLEQHIHVAAVCRNVWHNNKRVGR